MYVTSWLSSYWQSFFDTKRQRKTLSFFATSSALVIHVYVETYIKIINLSGFFSLHLLGFFNSPWWFLLSTKQPCFVYNRTVSTGSGIHFIPYPLVSWSVMQQVDSQVVNVCEIYYLREPMPYTFTYSCVIKLPKQIMLLHHW